MKLRTQLIIAFLVVICVSVGTIAVNSYDPILDSLVMDQRGSIREQGVSWLVQLSDGGISQQEWRWLARQARSQQMDVMMISPASPLPINSTFPGVVTRSEISRALRGGILSIGGHRYVAVSLAYYSNRTPYHLVLGQPLDYAALALKALKELGEIILVGGSVSAFLSLFLSRRIAIPLLALQNELRKVEEHRFSEVKRVHAGGEVGAVAESAYQLSTALGQYITTQKQFLRNISHELKTPLMSIQGYAEGIRDDVFTGPAVNRGLDTIVEECRRMNKLVNELILITKLESDTMSYDFQTVSIVSLVKEAVERLRPLLSERNLSITFNPALDAIGSPSVFVDEEKLLQALINILSNALRYAKTEIEIGIRSSAESLILKISDDGRGIDPDILPHLFHPFVKGKDGQNGLGLAIARAIIEQCGGTVQAYNREGGGTVIEVCLRFVHE